MSIKLSTKQIFNQPLITDDETDSEEDDGVFHDTPLEVQAQINEYLLKNSITKASFARTLNITSNALSRFLTSPEPRADNQTYEEACECFSFAHARMHARSRTTHAHALWKNCLLRVCARNETLVVCFVVFKMYVNKIY